MDEARKPSIGMARQLEVYLNGTRGQKPNLPISPDLLLEKTKAILSPGAYAYLSGGAGGGDTIRANLGAFQRWRIIPSVLRDVSRRTTEVTLLGTRIPAPVLLAPIGVQEILHDEAEIAVARAAAELGVPFILSAVSSRTLEEVSEAMGRSTRWFQLYWSRSRELTGSFLRRAEDAGYQAVVVTLDAPLLAWREREIEEAYLPFLHGKGLANYVTDPVFRAMLPKGTDNEQEAVSHVFTKVFADPALTWQDLSKLRKMTRLPILLKGILAPDDAARALDAGMDGIVVSNHGGRQLDGAIAALDALPSIVQRVGGECTILFDSGVRRGSDLFKAVALGAKAVLLGRPYACGLALGGQSGVREVLANFMADTDLTLGLAGCQSFYDVARIRPLKRTEGFEEL